MSSWKEIYNDPNKQNYTPDQWQEERKKYFREEVVPKLPDDENAQMQNWQEFNSYADSLSGGKVNIAALPDENQTAYQAVMDVARKTPEELEQMPSKPYAQGAARYMGMMRPLTEGLLIASGLNPFTDRIMQGYDEKLQDIIKAEQTGMIKQPNLLSKVGYGITQSALGKMLYSLTDPSLRQKIEESEKPENRPKGNFISSLSSIGTDLPIYLAGGAIGRAGATVAPALFESMGAFGLKAGLDALYDAKLSGELPTDFSLSPDEMGRLANVAKDVGKETAIGMAEGAVLHGVSKLTGKVIEEIGLHKVYKSLKPAGMTFKDFRDAFMGTFRPAAIAGLVAAKTLETGAEAGALTVAGSALRGQMPTWESYRDNVFLIGFLKLAHTPFERRAPKMDYESKIRAANIISDKFQVDRREAFKIMRDSERANAAIEKLTEQMSKENFENLQNVGRDVAPVVKPESPAPELENVVETVYPRGWDQQAEKVTKRAYSGEKYTKAREQMDAVISEVWPMMKENPEMMRDQSKVQTAIESQLVPHKTGYDKLSPGYQKQVLNELSKMAANELRGYETGSTEDLRPYQKVIPWNLGTEGNRIAFEEMQKKLGTPEPPKEEAPIVTKKQTAAQREDAAQEKYAQQRVNALGVSWGAGEKGGFFETADKDHLSPIEKLVRTTPKEIRGIVESIREFPGKYNAAQSRKVSPDTVWGSIGMKNAWREIERRYGVKMHDFFVTPIRQADHNYITEKREAHQKFKDFVKATEKDFGKYTHDEWERIGTALIGRQYKGPEMLAQMEKGFVAMEQLNLKEQAMVKYFDTELPKLLNRVNAAREVAGLEPIRSVQDYFTFLRQFSLAEELGINPIFANNEMWRNAGIEEVHPKGFSFRFGKERRESIRPIELNAANIFNKYLDAALRSTHMTPVVGTLRASLEGYGMLGKNPAAYADLTKTLDYIGGAAKKSNPVVDRIANRLARNLGVFYLAGNINSMLVQPAAYVLAWTELGTKNALIGIGDLMRPSMRKFAYAKSAVLQGRIYDITVEEIQKTLGGKLSKWQAKSAEWGMLPMKYFDLGCAEATWLAAYRKALGDGIQGKEAYQYADKMVVKTQGSGSRIDLAPLQRTPVGKFGLVFNTFTINQFNYIMYDVFGRKGSTNFEKAKMLGRMMAGMTLANTAAEIAGYYAPWAVTSTPFPAPISAAYKAMTGNPLIGEDTNEEERSGLYAAGKVVQEMAGIMPVVGGSFKYGEKSVFGAGGSLFIDTVKALNGFVENGDPRPVLKQSAKWAGVPYGSQMVKILRKATEEE